MLLLSSSTKGSKRGVLFFRSSSAFGLLHIESLLKTIALKDLFVNNCITSAKSELVITLI